MKTLGQVALDTKKNRRTEKEPNITDLSITELRATTGQCFLIDPNRRDLLFCIHENSTPEEPFILRYTKNTQAEQRKERKFRKLRESKKQQSPNINDAEQKLGGVSRSTSLPHVFSLYLIKRTKVSAELKTFYSNTSTDRMLHPVPLHRKLKLSSILNKKEKMTDWQILFVLSLVKTVSWLWETGLQQWQSSISPYEG